MGVNTQNDAEGIMRPALLASGVDERWSDVTVNWRLIQGLPDSYKFLQITCRDE